VLTGSLRRSKAVLLIGLVSDSEMLVTKTNT
jgi:hypothetical protein